MQSDRRQNLLDDLLDVHSFRLTLEVHQDPVLQDSRRTGPDILQIGHFVAMKRCAHSSSQGQVLARTGTRSPLHKALHIVRSIRSRPRRAHKPNRVPKHIVTGGQAPDKGLQLEQRLSVEHRSNGRGLPHGGPGHDLDLFILTPGPGGECDANDCVDHSGNAGTTDESVVLSALAGTEYHIVIDGYQGAVSDYALDITCDCTDRLEPNDTDVNATIVPGLTANEADLGICQGDEDWFSIFLINGDLVDINLAFEDATGDIDLELLDSSLLVVDDSSSASDNESISYSVTTTGIYFVRAFFWTNESAAFNGYDLDITITP